MYKVMIDYFDSKKNLVTIATHDSALIDYALSKKNKRFSYAFLMGVRESLQNEIVKKKQKVFVYAPHGKSWFAYYYRRIKERKENLIFAIKSIFRP